MHGLIEYSVVKRRGIRHRMVSAKAAFTPFENTFEQRDRRFRLPPFDLGSSNGVDAIKSHSMVGTK
ncbi:hypothetical protein FRACA_1100008 [Frankia canadensis]|uniref:Uncharacterized protein n=1 Tax=Frankia canadensis TaxID=1836972 RepID=A0A2I2KJC5_9ACTN|nr:hypothetical protein FRACA_1100008 [Frankia canadensis]SOU53045.1 hypothetical protein FRACA_1100008 [Frankia canadensis]